MFFFFFFIEGWVIFCKFLTMFVIDQWSDCESGSTGRMCARVWASLKSQLESKEVTKELRKFVKWVKGLQDAGRLPGNEEPLPTADYFMTELQYVEKRKSVAVNMWETAGKPWFGARKSEKVREENEFARMLKYVPKFLMIAYGIVISENPDGEVGSKDRPLQDKTLKLLQISNNVSKVESKRDTESDKLKCEDVQLSLASLLSDTDLCGKCRQLLTHIQVQGTSSLTTMMVPVSEQLQARDILTEAENVVQMAPIKALGNKSSESAVRVKLPSRPQQDAAASPEVSDPAGNGITAVEAARCLDKSLQPPPTIFLQAKDQPRSSTRSKQR